MKTAPPPATGPVPPKKTGGPRAPLPIIDAPVFDQVPEALASKKQWLLWRYEWGEGTKPRKIPYYISRKRRLGEQGGETDRRELADFEAVMATFGACIGTRHAFSGIGFAFLPGDDLFGVDLDAVIDAQGVINERAAAIIASCDSWTEISPSGTGVHIYLHGNTQTHKVNATAERFGMEIFCGAQFFVVTGRTWPGAPAYVRAAGDKLLKRLHKTVQDLKGELEPATSAPAPAPVSSSRVWIPGERPGADRQAEMLDALAKVNPAQLTHDEWLAVGMTLRAELGEGAGFVEFDRWSALDADRYPGTAALAKRWRSFKNAQGGDLVFKLARAAGWRPKRRRPAPAPNAPGARAQAPGEAPGAPAGHPDADTDLAAADEKKTKKKKPALDDSGWRSGLQFGRDGAQRALANIDLILSMDERWQGVVAFDEFGNRIVKLKAPPYPNGRAGEWGADDDTLTAIWLGRHYSCNVPSAMVAEAVEVVAKAHAYHPVRDWLRSITWDGKRRLDSFAADYLGATPGAYASAVGTYFIRGMVRRVFEPGCKFDYCLVLEGDQGIGKSSALAALGGEWYSDTDLDLGHKDSMSALRGIWLHEFAEMDSVARAEAPKQKSFLSRQVDKYRPTYARREVSMPRQTTFGGSTNETEYLRDSTGARRFWPIRCTAIALAQLKVDREQLFAEALADYDAGERCYPMPDESQAVFMPEQKKRTRKESHVDALYDWVFSNDRLLTNDGLFTLTEAGKAIGITADRMNREHETRIGKALAFLGCEHVEKRTNKIARSWYRPPARGADDSRVGPADALAQTVDSQGADDVPL